MQDEVEGIMDVIKNNRLMRLVVRFWMFTFLFVDLSIRSFAQNVTVDVSIDSLQRLIGEQAIIELEVSCDAKQQVILPMYGDTLITGIEIVDITRPDTQFLNNKERMLITQKYVITSFDSAAYYIPPFVVNVDGKEYLSKSLAFMVYPMEVDESQPDAIFQPKTIMQLPYTWSDWQPVVWKTLFILLFTFIAVYLCIRYRDNKPIIRIVKVEPKLPPHQQALLEIERIKAEKIGHNGDVKAYYTELTEVIRTYIMGRFGFNALEKTSTEIIDSLLENGEKESLRDLRTLFETADLVKFAKHIPLLNENDMNLINAMEFINQTKVEVDSNEQPESTEIVIEEKRSRQVKTIMLVSIVTLFVVSVVTIIYLAIDVYDLFF